MCRLQKDVSEAIVQAQERYEGSLLQMKMLLLNKADPNKSFQVCCG